MIYLMAEKMEEPNNKSQFTYGIRTWYQPDPSDIYILQPDDPNVPNGVKVIGLPADILTMDWKTLLRDFFASGTSDPTIAALLGHIRVFKSSVMVNNRVIKYQEVMETVDQVPVLLPPGSGVVPDGSGIIPVSGEVTSSGSKP